MIWLPNRAPEADAAELLVRAGHFGGEACQTGGMQSNARAMII
jgi:hypothetical protein